MPRILNVYALPSYVSPTELANGTAVVIDVLRASTTIVYALEAGAREVVPCVEVDEARRIASQFPPDEVVLGGERNGLPIDGFDLGNSPEEYLPERVAGKTVVFTTSNGTRAIERCRAARRVLIGAFVNATAVYQQLLEEEQVHLVCAGTRGRVGRDDVLMAGLLVERLQRQSGLIYELNVQAITARENWLASFPVPVALGGEPLEPERLAEELFKSPGGENLASIGLAEDIVTAACLDAFAIVPELVPGQLRIRIP
jgi:2-phosphosulfolactate phosphatase